MMPMWRARWVAVLAVATVACSQGAAQVRDGAGPARQSYAGLLGAGARWSFHVSEGVTVGSYDPREAGGELEGPIVDCRVAAAVELAGGRAAEVECDEPLASSDNPLVGTWAETDVGLFRLDGLPEPRAALPASAELFLSAYPEAYEHTVENPPERELAEETTDTDQVEPVHGGWCRRFLHGATRGDATLLCVGADGPIDGGWIWEYAEEIHASYFARVTERGR